MILALDFDGVIHDDKHPVAGKRMGEPMPGAAQAIEELQDQGHQVIIHTVRGNSPKHIEDWLEFYGFDIDTITATKPVADVYLDDKGMRFTSWSEALALLSTPEDID